VLLNAVQYRRRVKPAAGSTGGPPPVSKRSDVVAVDAVRE